MTRKETDRSRRYRFWSWFWRAGVVLLGLVIVSVLCLRWRWRAEFQRRVEAIRTAGFPVTGKELDAWYPWPPSGANAAHWITGAVAFFRKPTSEESEVLQLVTSRSGDLPAPTEPLTPELKVLLQQYVGDNARTLQTLHEAAAIAECRYPMDLSGPPVGFVPHISAVRDGCLLLALEALLRAQNQDAPGAANAVEAVVRVAQSLEKEPLMISHMVRLVTVNSGVLALERILNQIALPEGQLVQLQKVFEGVHTNEGLLRALAGNRCLVVEILEKPQAVERESFSHLPPVPLLEAYTALGLSAREGVVALDYVDECYRIAQLPPCERPAAVRALDARLGGRKGVFLRDVRFTSQWILRTTAETVWIGLAGVALAAERYRLAHGSPPETVDRLVPDYLARVPEDPFDGAPLRYKRVGGGFVVYSIGEDGQDDGGVEEPKGTRGSNQARDLVFRVERPS